jgi:ABC-type branched-subunit amino acid transport system substrate-binding protein
VLLATGDSYWGFSKKKYPWTIGFQTDYPGEGKIYGNYINKNLAGAKIGVLYQNDAFGKNYLAGLRVGLGVEGKSKIVSAQPFDLSAGNVTQQMLALKASGADTLVLFATPTPTIQALATAPKIGWTPANIFVNNVSAVPTFMKLAAANGGKVDGAISVSYLNDPAVPALANSAGSVLGKQILAKYGPTLDVGNTLNWYGLANAWTMVYALKNAGKTPTRAGLMRALKTMTPAKAKNPFLYPGVGLQTSAKDNFPLEQEILIRWSGGSTGGWTPFGTLYNKVR